MNDNDLVKLAGKISRIKAKIKDYLEISIVFITLHWRRLLVVLAVLVVLTTSWAAIHFWRQAKNLKADTAQGNK